MITDTLRARVDQQLAKLERVRFKPDPLFPVSSLRRQVEASAIKRHGRLIEAALTEALAGDPDYLIWTEDRFVVPTAADHVVQAQNAAETALTRLPYGKNSGRTVQIDLMAYSRSRRRLGAYEVKRGFGRNDSSKLRSMSRDLYGVQMALASYGTQKGQVIDDAVSRVIFYYGARTIKAPWSLIGSELDEHFGSPVRRIIEDMNDYLRIRLEDFAEGVDDLQPEARQLYLALVG